MRLTSVQAGTRKILLVPLGNHCTEGLTYRCQEANGSPWPMMFYSRSAQMVGAAVVEGDHIEQAVFNYVA